MRTITITNYSFKPPKIVGTVVLGDDGLVSVSGEMQDRLEKGVSDQKRGAILPAAGSAYLDALLWEFNGAYVRASEHK